jgi:hypothetical protein
MCMPGERCDRRADNAWGGQAVDGHAISWSGRSCEEEGAEEEKGKIKKLTMGILFTDSLICYLSVSFRGI